MENEVHQVLARVQRRLDRLESKEHQAMAVMDTESGKLLNYRQLLRSPKHKKAWSISAANEFGRLAQGVGGRIKGTNTIKFIHQRDVPKNRLKDVTYGQFVCTERPEKAEKNRTRFTVGGDRINYPGEVATPTAEMLVAKLLFNSTISTKGARFMTMDISNFYLNSPLPHPELLSRECLNLKCLPKPSFADMACRVGDMSATCLRSCRRLGDIACRLECLNDTTFDDI